VLAALTIAAAVAIAVWLVPAVGGAGGSGSADPAVPGRPADAFALTVEYVYDGDTIRATIASPNDVVTTRDPFRIRLIGIDTPEGTPTVECGADEARARLRELLPEGSRVWAAADRESWDRYDRRLFYLWTDDSTFVNHALVAAGHAEAMPVRPNVRHAELFADAEDEARASEIGRWGSC